MTKHILYITILCLFNLTFTTAQQGNVSDPANSQTIQGWSNRYLQDPYIKRILGKANEMPKPEEIKGSPYSNKKFLTAQIFINNKQVDEEFLRYNAFSDEMEIPYNDDYLSIIKSPNQKIILDGTTYICLKDNSGKLKYFIDHGTFNNFQLLESYKVIFKNGIKAKTSLEREIPPSFKSSYSYYLLNLTTDNVYLLNNTNRKKFNNSLQVISPKLAKKSKKLKLRGKELDEIKSLLKSV